MDKSKPNYSIVIPCFNEEKYIAKTLTSLNKQTYDGLIEIIVVDNNCSDKTIAIAKSFGARIVNESNAGVCWARQAGTKIAKAKVVISTDADTIYTEDWLKNIDDMFQRNNNVVAVAGPCKYRDGPWWGNFYTSILFGSAYAYSKLLNRPFYISATNYAFKKSAWEGYDVKLSQGGDEMAMIGQMKNKGRIVFLLNNPTLTSARRLNRGLFYNIFVSFFYYYLAGYHLNRIFNRVIIKPAPAYREDSKRLTIYKKIIALFNILFTPLQNEKVPESSSRKPKI